VELTVAAVGPADPAVVWDRYVYPDRWSECHRRSFASTARTVRSARGSRGRVHGPCGLTAGFQVLDVDPENRSWTWRVVVAGVTLTLGHAVQARGNGTRTTLDLSGPPPVVLGYAPVAHLALSRLVR
jgi:Polyketide cyclase / dehydrase and lipid transport